MTVHHKNLEVLVTEIFRVKISFISDIMKDVFELKSHTTYGQHQIILHAKMLKVLIVVSYQLST